MYHSAIVPIYHPTPYYHDGGAAPPGDHRPGANNLADEPPGVGKTPAGGSIGHLGPHAPSDMGPEGTAWGQTKADPVNAPYSLHANAYSVHGPGTNTGQPKGWPSGAGTYDRAIWVAVCVCMCVVCVRRIRRRILLGGVRSVSFHIGEAGTR